MAAKRTVGHFATSFLLELYVDHQNLDGNEKVDFDPRTCLSLKSLQVLNTSHNRMDTLQDLQKLRSILILDASNNNLHSNSNIVEHVCKMATLRELDLRGNPVAKETRHWETLVGEGGHICTLNGKPVSPNTRTMLKNMKSMRIEPRLRSSIK